MIELRYINPKFIRDPWLEIYDDLVECIRHETDQIMMEDIYHYLKSGLATLHIGYIDGLYKGFCILQRTEDPFVGEPRLHVWFCHNKAGHTFLQLFEKELIVIAKNIDAKWITFKSNRIAFDRLLREYAPLETTYFKEIL